MPLSFRQPPKRKEKGARFSDKSQNVKGPGPTTAAGRYPSYQPRRSRITRLAIIWPMMGGM